MIKKTNFLIILILLIPLTLFFCGNDGKDGRPGISYVALSWLDINSFGGFYAFPTTIINGNDYPHEAGTYTGGWYISWNLSYWTVHYTVEVNPGKPGKKGGLFSDGEDGEDGWNTFYTIYLWCFGPDIIELSFPALIEPSSHSSPTSKKVIQGSVDLSLYDLSEPIKVITISTTNQDVIFTVEYKQYKKRVDPE